MKKKEYILCYLQKRGYGKAYYELKNLKKEELIKKIIELYELQTGFLPKISSSGNKRNEDLSIIDFKLYSCKYGCNRYLVPVYVLTAGVLSLNRDIYETMVRIGYADNFEFLDSVQERCFSKLEAYTQHKRIYKKILNGFYDSEIAQIIEKEFITVRGKF